MLSYIVEFILCGFKKGPGWGDNGAAVDVLKLVKLLYGTCVWYGVGNDVR